MHIQKKEPIITEIPMSPTSWGQQIKLIDFQIQYEDSTDDTEDAFIGVTRSEARELAFALNRHCSLVDGSNGIDLIQQERKEMIFVHDRTIEYDVKHNSNGELAQAALMLLSSIHEEGIDSESYPVGWDKNVCDHMLSKDNDDKLVLAGAFIVAELDRLRALHI